jgi:uncharacterized membrane protein SirB2
MITGFLLWILYQFFSLVIYVFPNFGGLPTQMTDALNAMQTYLQKANSILPVDTMLVVIGIALTFEAAVLTFRLTNYIVNKVRGSG